MSLYDERYRAFLKQHRRFSERQAREQQFADRIILVAFAGMMALIGLIALFGERAGA